MVQGVGFRVEESDFIFQVSGVQSVGLSVEAPRADSDRLLSPTWRGR